jgi:hypothetical protein
MEVERRRRGIATACLTSTPNEVILDDGSKNKWLVDGLFSNAAV